MAACLSVFCVTAGAEEGPPCEDLGTDSISQPGVCPPVRVSVPFPGFEGNHGVDAIYTHVGATQDTDLESGASAIYKHHVVDNSDAGQHQSISLEKAVDEDGNSRWRVVRYAPGDKQGTVLSVCQIAVQWPWQCNTMWNPEVVVHELKWSEARQSKMEEVTAALRYAQAQKALGIKQATATVRRATLTLQNAIKKVRELDSKSQYAARVFGPVGDASVDSGPVASPLPLVHTGPEVPFTPAPTKPIARDVSNLQERGAKKEKEWKAWDSQEKAKATKVNNTWLKRKNQQIAQLKAAKEQVVKVSAKREKDLREEQEDMKRDNWAQQQQLKAKVQQASQALDAAKTKAAAVEKSEKSAIAGEQGQKQALKQVSKTVEWRVERAQKDGWQSKKKTQIAAQASTEKQVKAGQQQQGENQHVAAQHSKEKDVKQEQSKQEENQSAGIGTPKERQSKAQQNETSEQKAKVAANQASQAQDDQDDSEQQAAPHQHTQQAAPHQSDNLKITYTTLGKSPQQDAANNWEDETAAEKKVKIANTGAQQAARRQQEAIASQPAATVTSPAPSSNQGSGNSATVQRLEKDRLQRLKRLRNLAWRQKYRKNAQMDRQMGQSQQYDQAVKKYQEARSKAGIFTVPIKIDGVDPKTVKTPAFQQVLKAAVADVYKYDRVNYDHVQVHTGQSRQYQPSLPTVALQESSHAYQPLSTPPPTPATLTVHMHDNDRHLSLKAQEKLVKHVQGHDLDQAFRDEAAKTGLKAKLFHASVIGPGGTTLPSSSSTLPALTKSDNTLPLINTAGATKGTTGTFTRCASAEFGGRLTLLCPRGTRISKIVYADLGRPSGPFCAWKPNPTCTFPDAKPIVSKACVGKPVCTIQADLSRSLVKQLPEPQQLPSDGPANPAMPPVSPGMSPTAKQQQQLQRQAQLQQAQQHQEQAERVADHAAATASSQQLAYQAAQPGPGGSPSPPSVLMSTMPVAQEPSEKKQERQDEESLSPSEDAVVQEAVQDALNSVLPKRRRLLSRPSAEQKPLPNQLTGVVPTTPRLRPEACWAGSTAAEGLGRLVVQAECSGTMSNHGALSAPGEIIGHASLMGLPIGAWQASPAYGSAFIKAVEASMCQCDVRKVSCIRDSCAGAVKVNRVNGDEVETEVVFSVYVPPTTTTIAAERILTESMHSESVQYKEKEIEQKARVKSKEMVVKQAANRLELLEKAKATAYEKKMKKLSAQRKLQKETTNKESEHKIRTQQAKQEKLLKVDLTEMDRIRVKANVAREKAFKAAAVHQEAGEKKRAYQDTAEAEERRAKEMYSAAHYAQMEAAAADEQREAARNAFHHADHAATITEHDADDTNHQAAREKARATGKIVGGWLGLKDAVASIVDGNDGQTPLIAEDPNLGGGKKKKATESVLTAVSMRFEDSGSRDKTDGEQTELMQYTPLTDQQYHHPDGEQTNGEQTELMQFSGTWVPFQENFDNAVRLEGIDPPPMGDTMNVLSASQATAAADSAQLGTAAPEAAPVLTPPPPGVPLAQSTGAPYWEQPESLAPAVPKLGSSSLGGGWIFLIILIVVGILLAACWCYLRNTDRFRPRHRYSPTADDYYHGPNYDPQTGMAYEPEMPHDNRRANTLQMVMRELASANGELQRAPFHKRPQVQARINELMKWKSHLEDERRPLYATARDQTSAFSPDYVQVRNYNSPNISSGPAPHTQVPPTNQGVAGSVLNTYDYFVGADIPQSVPQQQMPQFQPQAANNSPVPRL